MVVISRKVYSLYRNVLSFPKENLFILNDGEKEKSLKNYTKILNFILKKGLTREDYLIAIGGGVVGDITGFAASTYMRGIKYIQIPTTLLACTDSSVGGKTAVNSVYGKNLIGSFYQPDAVFINVNFLKTLDQKQFMSGLGEVLKYAFIEKSCGCNEQLYLLNFLNENCPKIMNRDILSLRELIEICIKLKISVVNKDEKETGLRRILNYGHTFGHAFEKLSGLKKYTHGECVVYGIMFALDVAFRLGKIDKEYRFLCLDLINKYGFSKIPKYSLLKIAEFMKLDKKASDDGINYILPIEYSAVDSFKFKISEIISIMK